MVQRDCAVRGFHCKTQQSKSGKVSNSRKSTIKATWEQTALCSENAELWGTQ